MAATCYLDLISALKPASYCSFKDVHSCDLYLSYCSAGIFTGSLSVNFNDLLHI